LCGPLARTNRPDSVYRFFGRPTGIRQSPFSGLNAPQNALRGHAEFPSDSDTGQPKVTDRNETHHRARKHRRGSFRVADDIRRRQSDMPSGCFHQFGEDELRIQGRHGLDSLREIEHSADEVAVAQDTLIKRPPLPASMNPLNRIPSPSMGTPAQATSIKVAAGLSQPTLPYEIRVVSSGYPFSPSKAGKDEVSLLAAVGSVAEHDGMSSPWITM
jgi:hypothetical protein